MPALLALVDHAAHRVALEPAVRPGDSLTCNGLIEVHLLRLSDVGHLGEHAVYIAAMLRRAGWKVDVTDCTNLTPKPVLRGQQALTADAVYVTAVETGNHLLTDLGQQPEPVAPARPTARRSARTKAVCLVCGHATQGARHIDSHRRNRGHDDFEHVAVADVPALQAQVRLAQAHASAPEGQAALQEPSDQQVHGYTHPIDPAAVQTLPHQDVR